MTFIICISDYWHKRYYLQIDPNTNKTLAVPAAGFKLSRKLPASSSNNAENCQNTFRRLHLLIDGVSIFYMIRELHQFTQFARLLVAHPALRDVDLLWLQIVPPARDIIDWKWNHMVTYSLWEKIEVDYMMSWLSTLGGGFSALGEQFSRCAETAGKISLKQLSIGLRLGDPFLQARCKLYYSISLIQTGRLRTAKHIVREQYRFARTQKEIDGRLLKMCKGIWPRIQYEYGLRIAARVKQKSLEAAPYDEGDK